MSDPTCLKLSCDRKTRFYNSQKNALGLLPGPKGTCTGATTGPGGCWCKEGRKKLHTCYVDKCVTLRPAVKNILSNNTKLLKNANFNEKINLLNDTVDELQSQNTRAKKSINTNYYRFHWSGDIFNDEYAQAIKVTIEQHPNMIFWMYTRVFSAVKYLTGLENLLLFLSIDKQNIKTGVDTYYQYKEDTKLCYMAPEMDIDVPSVKFVHCPTDSGEMDFDGACSRCRQCISLGKQKHVYFKTT
ncbi:hypothetical protein ACFLQL_00710 [Verrucomicrobiota bacterium]